MERTQMYITEITYRIGITSRRYFSKLFKERYSRSPKQDMQKLEATKKKDDTTTI